MIDGDAQPAAGHAETFGMLSFQKLHVYQRAIEFLTLVGDITGDMPRGHAERADQLVPPGGSLAGIVTTMTWCGERAKGQPVR